MAPSDEDFAPIGDAADAAAAAAQAHNQPHRRHHFPHRQQDQQSYATHQFVRSKLAVALHSCHSLAGSISSPKKSTVPVAGGHDDGSEVYGEAFPQVDVTLSKLPSIGADGSFHDVNPRHCFATDEAEASPFSPQFPGNGDDDGDDGNSSHRHLERKGRGSPGSGTAVDVQAPRLDIKRKDRDDLADGVSPYGFDGSSGKKPKVSSSVDYRKDREDWSDSAIACLLDAYSKKYVHMNRGNLRGRDWEDVATIVSERCDKQKSGKSVEQCKNKVDNLKKRYKAERQRRLSSGSLSVSACHWRWFNKMEQIVGSSSTCAANPTAEEGKPIGAARDGPSAATIVGQAKWYMVPNPRPVNLTSTLKSKSLSTPRWRRVVLKISGKAFSGHGSQNFDPKVTTLIAREIARAIHVGVEVAVVVGGCNFFCGNSWAATTAIDKPVAYKIGMMASVMHSILLQASLEKIGVQTRVQTSFVMQEIAEPYVRRKAIRHLEKGRVVIFGGVGALTGTFCHTDTAAALSTSELSADAFLKGITMESNCDCHRRSNDGGGGSFEHISFRDALSRSFTALDATAITFCEENNIPVVLFDLLESGNISRALCGDQVGTLIDKSGGVG